MARGDAEQAAQPLKKVLVVVYVLVKLAEGTIFGMLIGDDHLVFELAEDGLKLGGGYLVFSFQGLLSLSRSCHKDFP